jgi:hypothetical protein
MSKNVCSIYKYTVGMLYAAGRGKKDDVKKSAFEPTHVYANQITSRARKKRRIKVCIISFEHQRGMMS